jgi:hypothetical protein
MHTAAIPGVGVGTSDDVGSWFCCFCATIYGHDRLIVRALASGTSELTASRMYCSSFSVGTIVVTHGSDAMK